MVVKKSRTAGPSRRAPRRRAPQPSPVPSPPSPPPAVPEPRKGLPIGTVLAALVILGGLGLWALRRCHTVPAPAATQAVSAPAPAAAAAAPATAPAAPAPRISRPRKAHAATTRTQALTLVKGRSLAFRCWRPAGSTARLAVFNDHYRRVRVLESKAGTAGWRTLTWDGRDDAGKPLPAGRYYVLPSQRGPQETLDVRIPR